VVIYPEAVWYGGVTLADVDEIIDSHIVAGKPGAAADAARCLHRHAELRAQAATGIGQ